MLPEINVSLISVAYSRASTLAVSTCYTISYSPTLGMTLRHFQCDETDVCNVAHTRYNGSGGVQTHGTITITQESGRIVHPCMASMIDVLT